MIKSVACKMNGNKTAKRNIHFGVLVLLALRPNKLYLI